MIINMTPEQKAQEFDRIVDFVTNRCLFDTRLFFINNNVIPYVFVNDKDDNVRLILAKKGIGLETLVNDKNKNVRIAVADHYFGLDQLMRDPDPDVRKAVAVKGHGLEILKKDPDPNVRQAALTILRQKRDEAQAEAALAKPKKSSMYF